MGTRNKTIRHKWWRLVRDDRGSHTVQELGWMVFWLTTLTAAIAILGPWVFGKAQEVIGF